MDWAPYKLLLVDATAHALLLVDGVKGEVLAELAYPDGYVPTALALTQDSAKAYLAAAGNNGGGCLFIANLHNLSLYPLPLELPHPMQFTLMPDRSTGYLVDPGGMLYAVDTIAMTVTNIGHSENASCVGITADDQAVYTAWEHKNSGSIAIFNHQGRLIKEHAISGIPTNIALNGSQILVPFTASSFTGEGLAIFEQNKPDDSIPAVITIQCPMHANALRAYPCSVTVGSNGQTAYVINEDSGSITTVDLKLAGITGHIILGRSISNLHLLPDSRFAVATSNMFADLTLVDLVNGRLLSVNASSNEILNYLAVLN